jgi:uncharacterized cupredoxin-like copper-binding protein
MRAVLLAIMAAVMSPIQTAADERTIPPAPHAVTIRLSEYRYEPARVEIQSGKPVELRLVNSGKVLHEFVTDMLSDVMVDLEAGKTVALVRGIEELEIPAGATVVLRFTPKQAGSYTFRCDAEEPVSHHDEGMKGTLIVR